MKFIPQTIVLLMLTSLSVYGQDTLRLSLPDAQEFAIRQNKSLQSARIDVSISESAIKQTIANGLPQVDASFDYLTYFNYEAEFNVGGGSETSFTADQIAQARQQTFDNYPGITDADLYAYQAGTYYNNVLSSMLPPSVIKMSDQFTGNVQVTQLLFSGQYLVGVQTARLSKKIAEQGLESSELDLKENIANSYFLILVTKQTLDIFDKNIENLKEIEFHTDAMYQTGMAELTDVDQIRIQVTMLENSKRAMQRSLANSLNLLRFQLGVGSGTHIELTEGLESILIKMAPADSDVDEFNIENNLLYQLTATQKEISSKLIEQEKWAFTPTISAYYNYTKKFETTGFDMTPNHLVGVTMNIPIFSSGMRKQKLQQAQLQMEQARLNQSMVTDQLNMQAGQLEFDLKTAIEDYQSQNENVAVAKRAFESVKRKYEHGIVSSLDLTQANTNYLQAETNYVQSVLTLLQAKIALDKINNQL